jgi:hypothetical protein
MWKILWAASLVILTATTSLAHNPLKQSEGREIRQLGEKCGAVLEATLLQLLDDAEAKGKAPNNPDAILMAKYARIAARMLSRMYGKELQMMARGETHQDRRKVLLSCAKREDELHILKGF